MTTPNKTAQISGQTPSDVQAVFARHETFHPRYGWLKKGFDAASEDAEIFLRPDATTRLGVGKNMVRAMRYWCSAYKALEDQPNSENPRVRDSVPTRFGESLLGSDGWDPYLEDQGSLWLLHWKLLSPPCIAPSWFAVFNAMPGAEFTEASAMTSVRTYCEGQDGWPDPVENSLKKDLRCFFRMFADVTAGRDLPEDSIDSPFLELELVQQTTGVKDHFSFSLGPKPTLPDRVLLYACLDFCSRLAGSAASISVSRLAGDPGSPGLVFKLTETALVEALERISETTKEIEIAAVAGARQLVLGDDPAALAEVSLERYYESAEALAHA